MVRKNSIIGRNVSVAFVSFGNKKDYKIKRIADILLALLLLFTLWPVLLIAAIWVRLESKGPVIFK